jgi:hypothetical protein
VGAPTSSVLEETYIEHTEHKQTCPILIKQQIITHFRYANVTVYNTKYRPNQNKHSTNSTNYNHLKCTVEKTTRIYQCFRSHNTLQRQKFEVFNMQKLTRTDITILNSACHPYEHKLSGINYLLNRLYTYPITQKTKVHRNKYHQKHTTE